MRDFKKLAVWGKARSLCIDIYKISSTFPSEERFGITSQIRMASVSISANISEGCGRKTDADFCRFLDISIGSCCEVECLLLLATDLGFAEEEKASQVGGRVVEVRMMLSSLSKKTLEERS